MPNLKKHKHIFLIDQETFIVLGKIESLNIANSICKGILNTSVMVVSTLEEYVDTKNYILTQQPTFHQGRFGTGHAAEIVQTIDRLVIFALKEIDNIPDHIKLKKSITDIRQFGFELLEENCNRYTSTLLNYFHTESFFLAVDNEIKKSNIDNKIFSPGIQNWASIYGTSPEIAFKKLKIDYDSYTIGMLKINAVWEKYSEKINMLTTIRDILKMFYDEFETEIFLTGNLNHL